MAKSGKVKIEFDGDGAALTRELEKMRQKYGSVEKALEQIGRKSEKAERAGTKAARASGKGWSTAGIDIKGYILQLGGAAAAAGVLTKALGEMNQVREAGASAVRASARGLSSLGQLGDGDANKLKGLIDAAKQMYREGGASTLDEAARVIFSLESAGALSAREMFGKLHGIVERPDVLARAATTMLTSMGREETGDIRSIARKAFEASKIAPAGAEELLEASVKGAGSAKALKWSDEGLLAATAIASKAIGKAPEAGTAIAALARSLVSQEGFKGLTIPQAVGKIKGEDLSDPELQKFLGSSEAMRGYTILRDNLKMFAEVKQRLIKAQSAPVVREMIESVRRQPGVMAALGERKAKAAQELGRMAEGRERLSSETIITNARARDEAAGKPWRGWAKEWGSRAVRKVWPEAWADSEEIVSYYRGTPAEFAEFRDQQRAEKTGLLPPKRLTDFRQKMLRELAQREEQDWFSGRLVKQIAHGEADPNFWQRKLTDEIGYLERGGVTAGEREEIAVLREYLKDIRDLLLEQRNEQRGKSRTMKPPNVDDGVGSRP